VYDVKPVELFIIINNNELEAAGVAKVK